MKKFITGIICAAMLSMTGVFAKADAAWSIESVTWQDPNNAVLFWQREENCTYRIYRSDKEDGKYELIGETTTGSYRDKTAKHPNTYYYKAEKLLTGEQKSEFSQPVASGTNSRSISSVDVIMYHNFVTEADEASGIEFDEYAMKAEDFEADLCWLRDNGYTTITSADLYEYMQGKKTLPEKAVIISIDDGSWGVYTNAWPLLKKYNMKADLNVIGYQIDKTWEKLHEGGSRVGVAAPYCTWEELDEMSQSGEINICSHTYGLHFYNRENRIGMKIMDNESIEDYTAVIRDDYALALRCIEGWVHKAPTTVAYPYSRRNESCDEVILNNTGYKILMAGEGARGTESNYFVDGCDFENQLSLMSRPCRMDGIPIKTYLDNIYEKDYKNGVNIPADTLKLTKTDAQSIAGDYRIFADVKENDWFAGSVYYTYLNGLMKGTSYIEFSPAENISRAMAATLLHRIAGKPQSEQNAYFYDVPTSEWYNEAAHWAEENGILKGFADGFYRPADTISREELAFSMYQCAKYMNISVSEKISLESFSDSEEIMSERKEAMQWAVASKIFQGNGDGTLTPKGSVTRAEMATILQNWINSLA